MQVTNMKLNNGKLMPILGLGTWDLTGESCVESVKEAYTLGYRHIDTAEMYRNEREIGRAIKEKNIPREKLFVVSKVLPLHLSYNGVLNACERSLSRLDTNYLDLYLIHWPNIFGGLEGALKAFKQLHTEGKIKSFGVSNFGIKNLREALAIAEKLNLKISVNQIKYNPFHHDDDLVEFCKKNNVAVTAYSPLGRGDALRNKQISTLAEQYKKTPSQIILKWVIQKGLIVIPKASSKKHLEENLGVFDFKLDEESIKKIDDIDR